MAGRLDRRDRERGMPSIHSSVSTSLRRALPIDARHAEIRDRPACSRPISDSAAASSRRSISMRDRARQRLHHGRGAADGASPARALDEPRAEAHIGESRAKRAIDAGAQNLDRDVARRPSSRRGPCAPARSRRPPPARRSGEKRRRRGLSSAASIVVRLRARERRHPVLQGFEPARDLDADDVGPRRQDLAELDVDGPSRAMRQREAGARVAAAPLDEARQPDADAQAAAAGGRSTRPNASWRASTYPTRASRSR